MFTRLVFITFQLLNLIVGIQASAIFGCDPEIFKDKYSVDLELKADHQILELAKTGGFLRTEDSFRIYLSERWFKEDGQLIQREQLFANEEAQKLVEWSEASTKKVRNNNVVSAFKVPKDGQRFLSKSEIQFLSEYLHYNRLRMFLLSENQSNSSNDELFEMQARDWKKQERFIKEQLLKSVLKLVLPIPNIISPTGRYTKELYEELIFKLHASLTLFDYRKGFEISTYIIPVLHRHLRRFYASSLDLNSKLWITNLRLPLSESFDEATATEHPEDQDVLEIEEEDVIPFRRVTRQVSSEELKHWVNLREKIYKSDIYLKSDLDRYIFERIFPEDPFQRIVSIVEISQSLGLSKQAVHMRIKKIRIRILEKDPGFGQDFLDVVLKNKESRIKKSLR